MQYTCFGHCVSCCMGPSLHLWVMNNVFRALYGLVDVVGGWQWSNTATKWVQWASWRVYFSIYRGFQRQVFLLLAVKIKHHNLITCLTLIVLILMVEFCFWTYNWLSSCNLAKLPKCGQNAATLYMHWHIQQLGGILPNIIIGYRLNDYGVSRLMLIMPCCGWDMPFFCVHSPLQKFCPPWDIRTTSSTICDARDIYLQILSHRSEVCI